MSHLLRRVSLPFALAVVVGCGRSATQPPACGASDGQCPSACTFYEDADCAKCSPSVGLTAPARPCSPDFKCVNLLGTYTAQGITEITTATEVPDCRVHEPTASLALTGCYYGGRGAHDDTGTGSPHSWVDADGTRRYWCESRPAGTSTSSRRPLLVYFHGSGGSAEDVYDNTLLRAKAESFDTLSGDSTRKGFILVSVQGRNLHWPTVDPEDGSKHDSVHRDVASNRDVAFVDHLIDALVSEGVVDPSRIYLTGWSNGARFAAYYGITRHAGPTPGGNLVAAVAPYSDGDPYENIAADQLPSCKQDPYPTTDLPLLLVSRNCDGVACNQEQFDFFVQSGWIMTPGNQVDEWIATLRGTMGDPNVQWLLIGFYGATAGACLSTTAPTAPCSTNMALRNHFCWPDGISDGGGNDRELDMLGFLAANPLP